MLLSSPAIIPRHDLIDTMGLNYFASSSPVVLPPSGGFPFANHHQDHHHPESGAVLNPSPSAFQSPAADNNSTAAAPKRFIPKYPRPPSLNYLARSSNGIAGRKRSRGDTDDDNSGDDERQAASRPIVTLPPVQKPEPILGPGMTLIYPDQPDLHISPESQSGTWMEEKAADDESRPRIISRKSQRCIDLSFDANATMDPIVLQLGIGWKRLSDAQASAIQGSETYIKKQFPVNEPRILLHHEGLGIYVVRTEPTSAAGYWSQWWLFRDDLKSCRFLCNDENDLFRRLSHKRQDERGNWIPDILAEGPEVFARHLSSGGAVLPPSPGMAAVSDASQQQFPAVQPAASQDVEMEM